MEVRLGYPTRGELEVALTQKSTTAIRPGDLAMWDEGSTSITLEPGPQRRWPKLVISVTVRQDATPGGSWRAGVLGLEPRTLRPRGVNARYARPA